MKVVGDGVLSKRNATFGIKVKALALSILRTKKEKEGLKNESNNPDRPNSDDDGRWYSSRFLFCYEIYVETFRIRKENHPAPFKEEEKWMILCYVPFVIKNTSLMLFFLMTHQHIENYMNLLTK